MLRYLGQFLAPSKHSINGGYNIILLHFFQALSSYYYITISEGCFINQFFDLKNYYVQGR